MNFHRKNSGAGTFAKRDNQDLVEQVIAAKAVAAHRERQSGRAVQ